jgi:RNA polymerase sigma-70 factor (ECF subfamily)
MANWVARLYDEHADAVYAFLLNLTRQEADASDLLQECFIKLVHSDLKEVGKPRAFILKLAYNQFIDFCRRQSTRNKYEESAMQEVEIFARTDDPDSQAVRRELDEGLASLPDEQRAVVFLKLWQDFTFEEIAQTLEISPNTAASRYRYGIDKLRGELRLIYEQLK